MQKIMRNSGFCNAQSILLPKSVIRKNELQIWKHFVCEHKLRRTKEKRYDD